MNPAPSSPADAPFTVVGRYAIFDEIASGGMATVHLGRLLGAAGFSRTVAIKRLHPQFARDPEFSAMFMDEARLAARINHPNVVVTIDVVPFDKEILLVMEYVHGAPFSHLLGVSRRAGWNVPPRILAGVMVGVLEGLHAAHEVKSEKGVPLGVVHRDVSPQNILIGVEGVPRVIDFGVAKALGKMHATRDGQLKGKLAYMSPEQVRSAPVTRVSDVFSAAIVLWEALTSERLFDGSNPAEIIMQVLSAEIVPPQRKAPDVPRELDAVVMKGLAREPSDRFASAREMAAAIEDAIAVAPAREIAEWVEGMSGASLASRAKRIEAIERIASAPPTAGERTRSEALKASLGAGIGDDLESGLRSIEGPRSPPRGHPPIGGAHAQSRRGDGLGFDATMPQKTRSDPPPPPALREPASGVAAKAGALAEAPGDKPAPSVSPQRLTLDKVGDGSRAPTSEPRASASGPAPRVHRIPVRVEPEDDGGSLAARLAWPIRLVVVGVLVSLVDFAVRQAEIALPVRPFWLAAILVVAGVAWAFVQIALPSRE